MKTATADTTSGISRFDFEKSAKCALVASIFFMPISTALTNVFAGATLVFWLLSGKFSAQWNTIKGNKLAQATLALFILVCAGSSYSSGTAEDILLQIHKYAKFLLIIPAISLLQEEKWRQWGLRAFAAAMLLTLFLSLASVVWPLPVVKGTAGGASGNHYVFRDHIAQNLMMSFFVLVMLVKGQYEKRGPWRVTFFAIAVLSAFDLLFFVMGRTGYIALAFNLAVFILFLDSAKARLKVIYAAATIALITIFFSTNFQARINTAIHEYSSPTSNAGSSIGQRVEFIKKSWMLIKERPILGFGTGSYRKEFCRVAETPEWCEQRGIHPHNQFLAFGVQLGLVGILSYLLFMGTLIRQALSQPAESKILGIGLVATLVADSLTHAPMFLVAEAAFFILLFPLFLSETGSQPHPDTRHF